MPLRPLAALLLVALLLPACDTAGEEPLTAAFFVGAWDLDQVRDATGDRTAEAFADLDAFTLTFEGDGAFTLFVDLDAAANEGGTLDATIQGTYQVSAEEQLVLTIGGVAPAFTVDRQSDDRVGLGTSAVIINTLLAGAGVDLELEGTVTLVLDRR